MNDTIYTIHVDDEDIMMFTTFWIHEMWTETPPRWWEWADLGQVHRCKIMKHRIDSLADSIKSGELTPSVADCESILKHFENTTLIRSKKSQAMIERARRLISETDSQEDG